MFGWLTRLSKLKQENAELKELVVTLRELNETDERMLASTMASLNDDMMRGRVWVESYRWHICRMNESTQKYIKEYEESYQNTAKERNIHINHEPIPTFDFPTSPPDEIVVRPRDKYRTPIRGTIEIKDLSTYIQPKKEQ
ncbi:hypothetical protein PARSHIK_142 [Erwinia phage vB_EamM_Parshik]|uniref:Uncharacterized protein n=1 Tax=Erwinia phage vB_EamM_Huxley TaxID=1883373 RepID=A0A1B2ID72_9CAUD|nr:hypothetical protein BIZ81_gp142 [Erwinia phage vB_EamM_Huxley]ANZ49223.1 hypothetical protein HUXLEY_141 [Erwinia phage vB_EamM_Huxley]ANZ50051.1 hypothetical protein PARSHIK_142 [Erwinia phage vB_EamM_Parshik]